MALWIVTIEGCAVFEAPAVLAAASAPCVTPLTVSPYITCPVSRDSPAWGENDPFSDERPNNGGLKSWKSQKQLGGWKRFSKGNQRTPLRKRPRTIGDENSWEILAAGGDFWGPVSGSRARKRAVYLRRVTRRPWQQMSKR